MTGSASEEGNETSPPPSQKSRRRDKRGRKNTGMFVKKVEQTFYNKRWYSLFGSHFFLALPSSSFDCCKFSRRSSSIGFNFEISFFALILSVLFVVVKNRFCVPSFANICIVPVHFFSVVIVVVAVVVVVLFLFWLRMYVVLGWAESLRAEPSDCVCACVWWNVKVICRQSICWLWALNASRKYFASDIKSNAKQRTEMYSRYLHSWQNLSYNFPWLRFPAHRGALFFSSSLLYLLHPFPHWRFSFRRHRLFLLLIFLLFKVSETTCAQYYTHKSHDTTDSVSSLFLADFFFLPLHFDLVSISKYAYY